MNLFKRYRNYIAFIIAMALGAGAGPRAGAQNNNVSLWGRVIDEKSKEPLAGAVVHIKGTTHEVLTNNDGEFKFITGQRCPWYIS